MKAGSELVMEHNATETEAPLHHVYHVDEEDEEEAEQEEEGGTCTELVTGKAVTGKAGGDDEDDIDRQLVEEWD
jgi:hypothetical protein